MNETIRIHAVSLIQDFLPGGANFVGLSVVNHLRRHPTEGRVMMLVVVPGKEPLAKDSTMFDATKTIRELGPVLERFEVRLREGIVVGVVRPAVRFGDSQIGQ